MMLEQRVGALERRVSRYRGVTFTLALALVAAVTMGQAARDVEFGTVTCRELVVLKEKGAGGILITSGTDGGSLTAYSAQGKGLVYLSAFPEGGVFSISSLQGKDLVFISSDDSGGVVEVHNKAGEGIVQLRADEYGNGVVGAYNRKGKVRTLTPGP